MKINILYFLVGLCLLFNFYLLNKISDTNSSELPVAEIHDREEEHSIELAVYMGRMQLFMNKLYFSGIANNAELTSFYLHELEEAMEEIEHAKIVDEGVDISTNIKLFGLNQIESLEEKLKAGNDFKEAYGVLVASCNNCHEVSKHPFIVIKEPVNPIFDNQLYEKVGY